MILVVDDEPSILHAFRRAFRDEPVEVRTASTGSDAVAEFQNHRPEVVVLDVHLPDSTGLETLHKLRQIDARVPIILITGHGTTELTISAMREGAFDYLLKPLELQQLREVIDRAMRSSRMMRVPAQIAEESAGPATGDLLVGRCPAMQEVYKAIGRVGQQDVTVLILGESGTGKELVARAIYQHSQRADKPFLAVNCAAIPENLLESELFGHEKGAFTGADRKRIGKFEQCSGGTIFLDEVGDMAPLTQAKILRVVQEQKFERVGGNEEVATDVRLIAATNADLGKMVEQGRFRKDLFFRLNVFGITLPPLRERGDDLKLLISHFLSRFSRELKLPSKVVDPEALAALAVYRWPGNIRELQSILKQAILKSHGGAILLEDLPPLITGRTSAEEKAEETTGELLDWDRLVSSRIEAGSESLFAEATDLMEKEVIIRVLRHTQGNQLQAAKILGITRGSLRTKIRAHGIAIGRSVWSPDDQDGA